MKFVSTLSLLAVSTASVYASLFSGKPDLEVKASFGQDNPYGHVVNGHTNKLNLILINHSSKELSVKSVSGAFKEIGGSEKHFKNTTTAKYSITLPPSPNNAPVPVTYSFHSETKPRELNLNVWVDYQDPDKKQYRELAYEGQVTVVEPKTSWLDPALLLVYLILTGLSAMIGLIVWNTYIVGNKKNKLALWFRGPVKKTTAAPSPVVTLVEKVDNSEWIPAHHKASEKKGRKPTSDGDATSGNESTGGARRRVASGKGKGKAK